MAGDGEVAPGVSAVEAGAGGVGEFPAADGDEVPALVPGSTGTSVVAVVAAESVKGISLNDGESPLTGEVPLVELPDPFSVPFSLPDALEAAVVGVDVWI